jgi:hypothetical protein
MNTKKKCRLIFFLPLMLFIAYLFLVFTGRIALWAGAGDRFFCGFYCYFGIAVYGFILGYFFINCGLSALWNRKFNSADDTTQA